MNSYMNKQRKTDYEEKPIHKFDTSSLSETSYVDIAEKVLNNHKENRSAITTSQIRNLLDLLNGLRERLRTERVKELSPDMMSQVQYIKLRFVYAAGRDKESSGVKDFINRSGLIECFDTVKNSPVQFELICKYMEALVAYHKYYIDK